MVKALVFAALVGSAAAFAPSAFTGKALATATRSSAVMKMAVQDMLGADVETGGVFDPLGYSKDEASLFRNREVELKHGRVAMLACLGVFVQAFYHLPDPVFSEGARPIAAIQHVWADRPLAVWQIALAVGAFELTIGKQDYENKAPGDLGNFGDAFKPTDDETWEKVQLRELKNGRLAMMAFAGMQVQEALTGQGPIEQLQVGHFSPFGDGQGFF